MFARSIFLITLLNSSTVLSSLNFLSILDQSTGGVNSRNYKIIISLVVLITSNNNQPRNVIWT